MSRFPCGCLAGLSGLLPGWINTIDLAASNHRMIDFLHDLGSGLKRVNFQRTNFDIQQVANDLMNLVLVTFAINVAKLVLGPKIRNLW